jgi:hypothetical protein
MCIDIANRKRGHELRNAFSEYEHINFDVFDYYIILHHAVRESSVWPAA